MDFRLSAEQEQIRHPVRETVTDFPGEYWQKLDRELGYPHEFIEALTKGGWLAALIPEEYGGFGVGVLEASLILEEINRSPGNGGVCHGQMYSRTKRTSGRQQLVYAPHSEPEPDPPRPPLCIADGVPKTAGGFDVYARARHQAIGNRRFAKRDGKSRLG